jgi:hypothetical protein
MSMSKETDSAADSTLPAPIVESYGTAANGKHWVLLRLPASTTTDPRKNYRVIRVKKRTMAVTRNASGNWKPNIKWERNKIVASFKASDPQPDGKLFMDEDASEGTFRYRVKITYVPASGAPPKREKSTLSDEVKFPIN